jgi:hypothetical protein
MAVNPKSLRPLDSTKKMGLSEGQVFGHTSWLCSLLPDDRSHLRLKYT